MAESPPRIQSRARSQRSKGDSKLPEWPIEAGGPGSPEARRGPSSPEIVVHRLEEELIAGSLQNALKVRQGDALGGQGQLHQVRRLLPVQVVDDLGLAHGSGLGPGGPRAACSGGRAGLSGAAALGAAQRLSPARRPAAAPAPLFSGRSRVPAPPAAAAAAASAPHSPGSAGDGDSSGGRGPPGSALRPGPLPAPGPGAAPPRRGPAPAPARPRWPRGRCPGPRPGPADTPLSGPAARSCSCAPVPGPRGASRRSPRPPEMEGQTSLGWPRSRLSLQGLALNPRGIDCSSQLGKGVMQGSLWSLEMAGEHGSDHV